MIRLKKKIIKALGKATPYLFSLPILLLSLIVIYGIVNILIQSLSYIPELKMTDFNLEQYKKLIKSGEFIESFLLSFRIAFVSSMISLILGVFLSLSFVFLNNKESRKIKYFNLAIITPHIITAFFFLTLFSKTGLFSRILYNLGFSDTIETLPEIFYSKNSIGIIISYVWKGFPFVFYFTYGIIKKIGMSYREAAENLGASRLRTIFTIFLPLSFSSIYKAFIILFVFSFSAYDLPYLIGATYPRALPVAAYIEYVNPDLKNRAYAMAINMSILLISWFFVFLYIKLFKKWRKYEK